MRNIRTIVTAIAGIGALVFGFSGVAGAGGGYTSNMDATCDPTTGTYVITLQINNGYAAPASMSGVWDGYDASLQTTTSGTLSFDPNPLPGSGSTVSVFAVPGDTLHVDVSFNFDYEQFDMEGSDGIDLAGDCELIPTTTTTTTTLVSTTTTTTAPAQVAQPRFTG
jgi:hypothetical protein